MTGPLTDATRILEAGAFPLECGEVLPEVRVAYRTWGRLDPRRPRGVLVCHALTGSADVDLWWPDLLGPGRALDPKRELVVCTNVLGGCYGTTGPASVDPRTGRPYGGTFPTVSVRDMVRLQALLLDHLRVGKLSLVIGGSLGGMQALEWAATFPDRVEAVAAIAVGAVHSPWCIALSEAQRQAIYADPAWRGGGYPPDRPPARGLAVARMTAMCSYRSPESFAVRFGREERPEGGFQVEGYLHHHGRKLVERFDAASYVALSRAMDGHDLGRGRGGVERALAGIDRPVLVVAVDSDVLYPPREQEELARGLPRAELALLSSPHGHDAFLIEGRALDRRVRAFRRRGPSFRPRGRGLRRVRLAVAGATGRVGSELLRQLETERAGIEEALGAEAVLVAAGNRRGFAWDEDGLAADAVRRPLAEDDLLPAAGLPGRLEALPPGRTVFVDCTAAPEVAALYGELLARGVAVVTASKLAPAGDPAEHLRLLALARSRGAPYRYETTVGAALPVLHAVAGLRLGGDRLRRLTAVLSGSLSYLCRRLSDGRPFSGAVRRAHALGLTEPRPWVDLSGEDVARKLVILLREAGLPADRDAVRTERLLPWHVDPREPIDTFFERLRELDPVWERRVAEAASMGRRLVPLARFDDDGARFAVEPVPADSPFARLEPGANLVLTETDRYRAVPLAIAGPGAGPAVTAAGVLADVVAAAREQGGDDRTDGPPRPRLSAASPLSHARIGDRA